MKGFETMNIGQEMAGMLCYFNRPNTPKITGIRNVRRVRYDRHWGGYTFCFEAEVNGKWEEYGPMVQGNYSVRKDCPDYTLPETDLLWGSKCTRAIYVGWYDLNRVFGNLPLGDMVVE